MSENLEYVLNRVNRFINIDKDRSKYTQHFDVLRNVVFNLLREETPFKGLHKGHSLQGSYGDNLKVSMPDEFDSVFIIKLPVYKLAKIKRDDKNAGNVEIDITAILEKIKNEIQNKAIYDILKQWINKDNLLVVDKIQSWLTSCFQKVLALMGDKIVVNENVAFLAYKRQGPAHCIKVTGSNGFFYSVDFVPGLLFDEEQNVLNNVAGTWLAIPKPLKPPQPHSTSFRSSFFQQESQIIKDTKSLKNVLRMMKKFRDCHQNLNNLKSYYIKTIFLMKAKQQEKNKTYWQSAISTIVTDMFNDLHSVLCAKKLPFFWDKRCNMFEHFTEKQMDEMEKCVANAKKTLARALPSMDDAVRFKIYSLFLTTKEREAENIFKPNSVKPNLNIQINRVQPILNQKTPTENTAEEKRTPEEDLNSSDFGCFEMLDSSISLDRKSEMLETIEDCTVERQEIISRGVARLIASNLLPISFVASDGFRDFMRIVEPEYEIPSESDIRSRIHLLYNEVKEKISKELTEADSVSISVNEWSSRNQDSYISIEAQYIDSKDEMCSVTLCNEQLEGTPNAENISRAVEIVLADWNLLEKTQAITHDGAPVMNAAAKQIRCVQDSIECSAHLLELAVKDALNAVPHFVEIFKKCRHVTAYFDRSSIAKSALSKHQIELGIPENRLLQCSADTRWNSKYLMCEKLLLNRNAINLVLADRSIATCCEALKFEMPENEWADIRKLVKILKPFDKATKVLCEAKNITLSLVRPLVNCLIKKHMAASSEDDENESKFKAIARESLFERFNMGNVSDDNLAPLIATFLDPRYKTLPDEDSSTKKKVYDFVRKKKITSNEDSLEAIVEKISDMDFFFDTETQINSTKSQIDRYMDEPQIGHNMNPLTWWNSHKTAYPDLFKFFKRYLSIPATLTGSKRTSSIAGDIVTSEKSYLLPENVSLLTFLYKNKDFIK